MRGLELAIDSDYKPSVIKELMLTRTDIDEVDSVSYFCMQKSM